MNKDLTVFLERTHPRAAQIPLLLLTVVFPRYVCDRTASFAAVNGNVSFRTVSQALGQAGSYAPEGLKPWLRSPRTESSHGS